VIAGARMLHWTVRARLEHPELPRSDGCEHEYREPRGDGRPERPKGKAASIRPLGPPNSSWVKTAEDGPSECERTRCDWRGSDSSGT